MRSDIDMVSLMKMQFVNAISPPVVPGGFSLFGGVCVSKIACLEKWMLELCYLPIWPLNSCLHSLLGSNGTIPWVLGPAAKTTVPRENEEDRRLCSLLMSTQSLWFCIWNRDVKLVARWTVKKRKKRRGWKGWITQVWIYFVPASLLFFFYSGS